MCCNLPHTQARIATSQCSNTPTECLILQITIILVVGAFELNTNREIVAALLATVAGLASMPGTPMKWHKLNDFATAPNEDMGTHLQAANFQKIRMLLPVQRISKQALDEGTAVFAWRAKPLTMG